MAHATVSTRTSRPAPVTRLALARQAFVSLAVVLVCYWLYWFIAVPVIEPGLEDRVAETVSEEQIESARVDMTLRQREIAQYFGPDDWESNSPAITQSGQIRLLFKTLSPRPDGTVELRPCTLMFFPKGPAGADVRPVIMRAVAGADVRFDKPVSMRSSDLSNRKFTGGQLLGEIRIFQRESAPGAGDDLEITTRDVQLSSDRAWTPRPVNFRMGRSIGSGRDLEILLGSDPGQPAGGMMRGMTVQLLRLKRDVHMRLEMQNAKAPPGVPAASGDGAEPPVEISCQGNFEFDFGTYAASFHDRVDVLRLNPSSESDQLNCQLLTVYFSRSGQAAVESNPPQSSANPSPASNVRLIEARGNPVTMRSPTQGMYARCNGVDYVPGAAGSPGSLSAFGPGVIQGNLPDDSGGKYMAKWDRELRFEPDGPLYRATLRGATQIDIGQMGVITSDEFFAWLRKTTRPGKPQVAQVAHRRGPAGAPSDEWQIERIVARRYQVADAISQGDVVIQAPQLYATANTLEATVMRQPQPSGAGGPAAASPAPRQQRPAPGQPNERFEVVGRIVRISLVPNGEQMAVASATIEQNAQLEQFAIAGAAKNRTLLVKGDRLHVADAQTDATRVTIAGAPGYVEAAGMTLWGQAIELEKSTNHLWIDGPGRLTMPVTQDLNGQQLARPQALSVDWKRRMDFRSDTAVFQGSVVARNAQQVVNTEQLDARLTRQVDFSNPNMPSGPQQPGQRPGQLDLAAVRTHGRTMLESRQVDPQGQQETFSYMEVSDLSIDRTSGKISGVGPGFVRHISRGAPQISAMPGQPAAAPPPGEEDKLTYLHVRFRKGIDGNINRREVTFFDRTRTIYAPARDWNVRLEENDPGDYGPRGMSLDADALTVREMEKRPDGKRGWFELDATGTVLAEGDQFTAIGRQLTYAERNDQLVLRGDPAELYIENQTGGPRHETRASQVNYWFADGRVSVDGAKWLNLAVPGSMQRRQKDQPPKQTPPPQTPAQQSPPAQTSPYQVQQPPVGQLPPPPQ